MPSWVLHQGDCLEVLRTLADASVDAMVGDPPSGIGFMGAEWDKNKGGRDRWIAWLAEIMAETRRVLKPGAYGLVWALPRTSHWTATALEDAGFEVRDRIAHIFGQGFPKHKSALKPAVEDWWLVRNPGPAQPLNIDACRVAPQGNDPNARKSKGHKTEGGGYGGGYGVMADRSWDGAAGRWPPHLLLSHADGCERVGVRRVRAGTAVRRNGVGATWGTYGRFEAGADDAGYADADGLELIDDWRCVDGCPVRALGEMSGKSASRPVKPYQRISADYFSGSWPDSYGGGYTDAGTAARFFPQFQPDYDAPFCYAAKASRRERNAGCEGLEERAAHERWVSESSKGQPCGGIASPQANHHPTVKPLKLMLWLCRLITPMGGLILDPFAGSGTTGVAAIQGGYRFIGIEREASYCDIARARMEHAAQEAPCTA